MPRKVALVTGGGSGIGEACALRLAEAGMAVVVVDRDRPAAERVASIVQLAGGLAAAFEADVTEPEECRLAVAFAVTEFGGLDAAVNNAGIGGSLTPVDDYDVDEWRRVMAVNIDGVFYCLREELRHMRQHGGAIVNMASMFSVVARDSMPAYVASKHAVLGLTRAAAIDMALRSVRVNCVGPAVIRTPLLESSLDADGIAFLSGLNPTKRLGEPREVANAVAWLLSDEASFVNGAFYAVDGGFTAA